jgi:hypothetical protein
MSVLSLNTSCIKGCSDNLADANISILLQQWQERLLLLKSRWANPMVPVECFDAYISHAQHLAEHLSNSSPSAPNWKPPTVVIEDLCLDPEEPDMDANGSSPPCDAAQSLFADIFVDEQDGEDLEEDDDLANEEEHKASQMDVYQCDSGDVLADEAIPIIWALPVSIVQYSRCIRQSNLLYRLTCASTIIFMHMLNLTRLH